MQRKCIEKREVIVPIGPSIAYVPLTRGTYALIDVEDAARISARNWYAKQFRCGMYAASNEGNRTILMHREVMPVEDGVTVDHIHHATLDNRKSQLRPATQSQQCMNRKGWSNAGYKGIHQRKDSGRWYAYIDKDGKRVGLGSFGDLRQALAVRLAAQSEKHGAFA